jgi:hypothetical protein
MTATLSAPHRRPIAADQPELEKFYYDDAVVRKFLVMMYV